MVSLCFDALSMLCRGVSNREILVLLDFVQHSFVIFFGQYAADSSALSGLVKKIGSG